MSVTLRPMRADEYPAWAEQGERGYVYQMIEFGGMERDAAEAKAVRDFATVLPEGLQTEGHWLYMIEADGQSVGCLWFAERDLDGARPRSSTTFTSTRTRAATASAGRRCWSSSARPPAAACITCR
jgi:hypothetical protein